MAPSPLRVEHSPKPACPPRGCATNFFLLLFSVQRVMPSCLVFLPPFAIFSLLAPPPIPTPTHMPSHGFLRTHTHKIQLQGISSTDIEAIELLILLLARWKYFTHSLSIDVYFVSAEADDHFFINENKAHILLVLYFKMYAGRRRVVPKTKNREKERGPTQGREPWTHFRMFRRTIGCRAPCPSCSTNRPSIEN